MSLKLDVKLLENYIDADPLKISNVGAYLSCELLYRDRVIIIY